MIEKIKILLMPVRESWKKSPVEIVLGVLAFLFYIYLDRRNEFVGVYSDLFALFPFLISLSFVCNKLFLKGWSRILYYLTFFVFLIFLWVDLSWFIHSNGYRFGIIACFIALLSTGWKRDNVSFTKRMVWMLLDLFFGFLVSYFLMGVLSGIYASIDYVFGLQLPNGFYEYLFFFTNFVSFPVMFFSFEQRRQADEFELPKVFHILVEFILSPAIVIYTIILYIYFIKIAFLWELPKGQVAYMVFAFVLSAIVGKACEALLKKRYFNWFYSRFSWFSLPPLIMFWVGTIYRIQEYGLTEERIYLLAFGGLASLCMLMFLLKRLGHYAYISLLTVVLISLITFIPMISARSLAVSSQFARVEKGVKKLKLADENGILRKVHLDTDTLHKEEYRIIYESLSYLNRSVQGKKLLEQYGVESMFQFGEKIVPSHSKEYVLYGSIARYTDKAYTYTRSSAVIDVYGYAKLYELNRYEATDGDCPFTYSFETPNLLVTSDNDTIIYIDMMKYLTEQNGGLMEKKDTVSDLLVVKDDSLLTIDIDNYRLIINSIKIGVDSSYYVQDVSLKYILTKTIK